MLAAGQIETARTRYVAQLTEAADLDCAISGLDAIAQAYLERGEAFLGVGLRDSARLNFVRALSERPTSEAAWEAQRQILGLNRQIERAARAAARDTASRAGLAATRAFAELGLHENARKALEEALTADPTLEVPPELQYLSGGPWRSWRRLRSAAERWIRFAPGLLALIVVGGWLMLSWLRRPRLLIEDFDTGALKDASKLGEGFGVMVGTRLLDLASGAEVQRLDWISAPVGEVSIPAEVQRLVPGGGAWMEAALKLTRMITPQRNLSLGGHLHENETHGLGVTLQIRRGRHFVAGVTVWLGDFLPDAGALKHELAYPALAEVGTAWLLYHLQADDPSFSMLGARDWRAFAMARLARRQRTPSEQSALLVEALRRDSRFWGALASLGGTFFGRASALRESRPTEAKKLLEQAKGFLKAALAMSRSASRTANDPTPFTALYTLSLVHDALGEMQDARARADELLTRSKEVIAREPGSALAAYVTRMRPTVELMLAVQEGRDAVGRISDREAFNGATDTQYAVAAAWSRVAAASGASPERTEAEDRALLHLERCFAIGDERLRSWALRDWSMDWIRTAPATRDRFAALVTPSGSAPAPKPAAPLPLAEMLVVAPEHAAKLATLGATDWEGLLLRAGTPDQRTRMANSVGVPERLVETWAHLADMQRIVGLRATDANMLYLGGVHTLQDLASTASEVVLTDVLSTLARSHGVKAPDVAAVTRWIRDAGALPVKVV